MAVPATRNKILPARGNYSDLNANVASLLDGEICYAIDQDQYYQKEGSVLVSVGASKAQGILADSALQPGDNISELTNDAGYLQPTDSVGDLSDVDTTTVAPTSGQVLEWDGANWVPGTGGAAAIDDLSDVDTTTSAPTTNQVLAWNGVNWVPVNQSGGGGGGAISTAYRSEQQTATSGAATFTGIGQTGTIVDITSNLNAWIVLYPTAAARTADAGRSFGTDPAPGSGVLAEFYVTAASTILASPGTTYFNNDTTKASAIYAAVRDQAGANVNAAVTITAYAAGDIDVSQRSTTTVTTASIADTASDNVTLTNTGRSGQLISIATDRAAWVVLYSDQASRTADAGRAETTDPAPGSGVLAEVVTTGAETVVLTPVVGYFNNEATPVSELYLKVTNKSGLTSTVQVDVVLNIIEDGTFLALGGDLTTSSINELSDVDTATVAPTDGQVLRWNSVTSNWEPQDLDEVIDGGNLETGTSAGDGSTVDGGVVT